MEKLVSFLGVLALVPITGAGVVWMVHRMVAGDVGALQGLVGIGCLLSCLGLAAVSGSLVVTATVALVLLAVMVTLPFAEEKLAFADVDAVEVDRLERMQEALRERPDNAAAWLALAKGMHDFGLRGQAVAVADRVLSGMSTSYDPFSNRNQSDIFANEARLLARWKAELRPRDLAPVPCPRCGSANEPGSIACNQCQGPYVLDVVRLRTSRSRVLGRIVVSFGVVAVTLGSAALIGLSVPSPLNIFTLFGALVLAGGILAWLFRPQW
ncbi:MAG: zinc ribbon domain-containing protein [Fimbriimonadaceae bacterium]|nr:zinc ribbon domain-containing protein [Fimbriimonadaceae bacterium]QYK56158.1 MAG: zinc ribbon domain-containing protein [Fimbriimonadaceae bacterium]